MKSINAFTSSELNFTKADAWERMQTFCASDEFRKVIDINFSSIDDFADSILTPAMSRLAAENDKTETT